MTETIAMSTRGTSCSGRVCEKQAEIYQDKVVVMTTDSTNGEEGSRNYLLLGKRRGSV